MTKIGLRATVALLTKGYTKKEIEELAAIDEEQDNTPEPEEQDKTPEPEDQDKTPEPDYKQLYEDLKKQQEAKDKEIEDKDSQIKELQKDNIHENNLPEIEKQLQEEAASLNEAFKSWY